jgi:hypothetical protein
MESQPAGIAQLFSGWALRDPADLCDLLMCVIYYSFFHACICIFLVFSLMSDWFSRSAAVACARAPVEMRYARKNVAAPHRPPIWDLEAGVVPKAFVFAQHLTLLSASF